MVKRNKEKFGTKITVYFYKGEDNIEKWREKLIAKSITNLEKKSDLGIKVRKNGVSEIIRLQYPDALEKHIQLVSAMAENKGLTSKADILKAYKKIRGQTGAIMLVGKKPGMNTKRQ